MSSGAKKKWKHRHNGIHPELRKQLASTGLWKGAQPVSNAPGEEKMSSVLLDFVAPYIETAESEKQFQRAIEMGRLAWNIALFPPDARKGMVDHLIEQAVPTGAADFIDCINEMVERKERYFADCRRWILALHVEMTRRGPSVSVVSTAG